MPLFLMPLFLMGHAPKWTGWLLGLYQEVRLEFWPLGTRRWERGYPQEDDSLYMHVCIPETGRTSCRTTREEVKQ